MDVTLIKRGDYYQDTKTKQKVVLETEITRLTDSGMILLHKAGLRPLYVQGNGLRSELELIQKPMDLLEKPDLILYSPNDTDIQSAKIIQFQLAYGNCSAEIRPVNFIESATNTDNLTIYKNMFEEHLNSLAEEGRKHVVIIADEKELNKMAFAFNGKGLNKEYNLPIYFFSDGKEVIDRNLINAIYATRDLLDSVLLWQFENSKNPCFKGGKGKYKPALENEFLRYKLNLPRNY